MEQITNEKTDDLEECLMVILNQLALISEENNTIIRHICQYGTVPFGCNIYNALYFFSIDITLTYDKNKESDFSIIKGKYAEILNEITEKEYKIKTPNEVYERYFDLLDEHINTCILLYNDLGSEKIKQEIEQNWLNYKRLSNILKSPLFLESPRVIYIMQVLLMADTDLVITIFKKMDLYYFNPLLVSCLEGSEIDETVQSFSDTIRVKYNFKPTLKGFVKFLSKIGKLLVEDTEVIGELLAEHVIDELVTFDNNIEKAKNKRQTLIETTPHQTLSIETTTANVEEGKEVEKKKICKFSSLQIAIAVTMVNQKNGLLFPKEFSKKDIEAKKKFLKDIKEKFLIENVPNDQLFRQYAKLQLSKEYLQNLSEPDKQGVKRILELGRYTELLKDIK